MQQGGARSPLAGRKDRPFDLLLRDRIALEILEELEARSEQPEANRRSGALPLPVHADAVQEVHGKAKSLRTTFTETEINAYMVVSKDIELPVGVRDPRLTIDGGNHLSGRAVVDLDKVRLSQKRGVFDPMNLLLRGTVEVKAQGVIQASNGTGTFQLESATLGGVPIPKSVLQELVYYYTKTPDHPNGFSLDKPFELGWNIRAVEFTRGSATIIQ